MTTTREQREAYRPAFEAWVDGELQSKDSGGCWRDWSYINELPPAFGTAPERYRRRPKPLEFWRNVYACYTVDHKSPESAKADASGDCIRVAVHMREVVE